MKRLYIIIALTICLPRLISAQQLYIPKVDNSSYRGKAMFGYQGWFAHPDDDSPRPHYWHWGNMDQIGTGPLEVEMFPDLREFCPEERYETAYTFPDGEVAKVFSSGNRQTVLRHMKWVRDYNTDGVWVQRFISEYNDRVVMAFRDSTTKYVMEGSEKYGRVFAIMYDGIANRVEEIKTDWKHLVDNLEITDSESYLHHNNRPLVALWGYTVRSDATVDQLEELIEFFHNNPEYKYRASIKLGVNDNWFNKSQRWQDAFAQVEVISPWSVGRFGGQSGYNNYVNNQLVPGLNWSQTHGVLYVPVLFPGFSWHNLQEDKPKNQIPRDGGNFFWMQAHGAISKNVESLYFAMFDEVDEGTAFFKTAEDASQSPAQEYWLNLDADGYDLPSDWFLRAAGKAAQALRGNLDNSDDLGVPEEGIMTVLPGIEKCAITLQFPVLKDVTTLEVSIDGGDSFPYSVDGNAGSLEISGLEEGIYDIYVRDTYSVLDAIPMGKTCVSSGCLSTSTNKLNQNQKILVYPNPAMSVVNISGLNENSVIKLTDLNGKVLFTTISDKATKRIDISHFPVGIFILSVKNNSGKIYKKVNKIH